MPRVVFENAPMLNFGDVDAANTPARLMDISSYISGYVDGEGCFTVSFSPRTKLRMGWEVRPSFSVSQNADRAEVLAAIRKYFNCGGFRPDRSDKTLKYEVRDLKSLISKVIPHFERYPLMSSKRRDFETFAAICRLLEGRAHLNRERLREIARLAVTMNSSGKRRFQLDELIDYISA
jgi:LAGLIDADG endonuclease